MCSASCSEIGLTTHAAAGPADPELSDRLGRGTEPGGLVGVGGTWRSFETTVVIAAPLLTALIGIATGK